MAKQYTRDEVLSRFKATIAEGKPVVIAGAGTGISGKFAERGGADLVGVYNSGLYRMDGNGSLAGLMPYGNANDIVIQLANRVFPQIKEAPMIAGICGSDPTREMKPFLKQLLELGFSPREARRGRSFVTYFKQSEAIADFLTCIGAPVAAMELMAAKVEKDMRNVINRKVNCDTANADKTVAAAQQQLAAIRRLEEEPGLGSLPEGLQQAALLRIANPEASLADLAQLSVPSVTKSCLSHRLKKLVELAERGASED